MLEDETSELQSRLDITNKQVNKTLVKKYQELKNKEQHDTPTKDDLVCI